MLGNINICCGIETFVGEYKHLLGNKNTTQQSEKVTLCAGLATFEKLTHRELHKELPLPNSKHNNRRKSQNKERKVRKVAK